MIYNQYFLIVDFIKICYIIGVINEERIYILIFLKRVNGWCKLIKKIYNATF